MVCVFLMQNDIKHVVLVFGILRARECACVIRMCEFVCCKVHLVCIFEANCIWCICVLYSMCTWCVCVLFNLYLVCIFDQKLLT